MKLLWREHIPLIMIYIFQLFLVVLIFWLDGYRHLTLILYSIFLSLFLLACYLGYRYIRHRSLYQRLTKHNSYETMEEILDEHSNVPLVQAMNQMLSRQHRLYHNEIRKYENQINHRVTFMNQWVHQMKTPLSVIHLTIQHENDPLFDNIREEVDRVSDGLDLVLYSSRLEQMEQDFVVEPVDLEQLVRSTLQRYKRLIIRNRIYPELKVNQPWRVATDEKWLSFIVGQLLTNAVRYSSGKGQKVILSVYMLGKNIILSVEDEGVGIPLEDQERVFNAYFTGYNGRRFHESTGMGLYLVAEVCRRLGHRVELDSELGTGTIIRIIFDEHI